jgi:hypothetical protein
MRLSWIAEIGLDRPRKQTAFQMDDTEDIKLELKNTMNQCEVTQEMAFPGSQSVQLWKRTKLDGKL